MLASSSPLHYTFQPTQLTGHSKTLIDNIFCNITSNYVISGNISSTTSDHLPHSLIAPNVFANHSSWSLKLLKETGQILIKNILFLTTSLSIRKPGLNPGICSWCHQTVWEFPIIEQRGLVAYLGPMFWPIWHLNALKMP